MNLGQSSLNLSEMMFVPVLTRGFTWIFDYQNCLSVFAERTCGNEHVGPYLRNALMFWYSDSRPPPEDVHRIS